MKLDVLNSQGKSTGRSVELPQEIFGAEPNNHVIYLAVKQYLAAQRQGTHKVKTRAEVKGASRKLHKQKGTGGSRKGNIRNPLYKGGGTIFGPKPHAYDIKLNRKVKDLAKISALSHKAKEQAIVVLEDLKMEKPQTKQFASILSNLKLNDKKVMYVQPEHNNEVELSIRNLPAVLGVMLSDINTYDIMNSNMVVFVGNAHEMATELLKK